MVNKQLYQRKIICGCFRFMWLWLLISIIKKCTESWAQQLYHTSVKAKNSERDRQKTGQQQQQSRTDD